MPDLIESVAHGILVQTLFADNADADWKLQNIWADATTAEMSAAPEGSRAREGHVYPLDNTSTIKRGDIKSQNPVWPPMWSSDAMSAAESSLSRASFLRQDPDIPVRLDSSQPSVGRPGIQSLELQAVHYTYSALILDLGRLWSQVRYLTRTSVQLYRKDHWNEIVTSVPQSLRGFKIGMALGFGDFVLAFVVLDLLLQPLWALTRNDLPTPPVDPYEDRAGFIRAVIRWRTERRTSKHTNRKRLVVEVMRDADAVFPGIAVHIINELCFIAGVSPMLSECEVWDNPSRASRFVEAYISRIIRARNEAWTLLRPCIKDGLLAPSAQQRMMYTNQLNVYGKDRASMPQRLASLVDGHKAKVTTGCMENPTFDRHSTTDLLDCFEPTYIQASLSAYPTTNLQALIFEPTSLLSGKLDSPPAVADDGLSEFIEMFRSDGLLSAPTFLPSYEAYYTPIFLQEEELSKVWRSTHLYKASDKHIWSVTPAYPDNCIDGMSCRNKKERLHKHRIQDCQDKKATETFYYKIHNTRQACVGPLEYFNNARVMKTRRSIEISACRGDPAKHKFFEREMRGINRMKVGADRRGTRKSALTGSQRFKLDKRLKETWEKKEKLAAEKVEEGPGT